MIYKDQFGIDLPEYPGLGATNLTGVCKAFIHETTTNWVELATPDDGCAVGLSQSSVIHHIGIWIAADGGKVVHSYEREEKGVVADTIRQLRLKGFRTIKFYGLHRPDEKSLRAA